MLRTKNLHLEGTVKFGYNTGHVSEWPRLLGAAPRADVDRRLFGGTPHDIAREYGHAAMAAWLARIQPVGWKRHLCEPRYKLVVLRELVARGRAARRHLASGSTAGARALWAARRQLAFTPDAFFGREQVLDFLFPGDQPAPQANKQANKQARRGRPHLPDELFSIIRPLLLGRRAVKTARIATGCHGLCKY